VMTTSHTAGARPEKWQTHPERWQIHKERRCEAQWNQPRGRIASKCRGYIRGSRHSPHYRSKQTRREFSPLRAASTSRPTSRSLILSTRTARRTPVYDSTMCDLGCLINIVR
jgi:hypothetical protein